MRLFNDDSIEVLKSFDPCSIDAIVTDPPYGLGKCSPHEVSSCLSAWVSGKTWQPKGSGFMGKSWDSWVPPPELWKEVFRVLKPGGHILAFAGSRTQDLMSISLRLAGFEVRDIIQWLYGSGFPKSHDVSKSIDKIKGESRRIIGEKKTGMDKSSKQTMRFSKKTHLNEKGQSVFYITAPSSQEAKQWEGWGTALKPAYEPVILCRKPFKGSVAQNVLDHGTGAINIDGCRIETDDYLGRTSSYNFNFNFDTLKRNKKRERRSNPLGRWASNVILDNEIEGGEWKRFFYCPKASREEKEAGFEKGESRKNIHPTVKPIDLMRYLCRLITPPGGTILDPFMGSGSTGIGAGLEGFEFVGIEREKEYFEIAEARIKHWVSTPLTYSKPDKETEKGEQLTLF